MASTSRTIPGYYTIDEAAAVIGVSGCQVTRYIHDGRIKAINLGRQWLIEQQEVHQFQRPRRGNPNFVRKSR